jgi:DNA repair exonuclease SbcCD ATPase subunit
MAAQDNFLVTFNANLEQLDQKNVIINRAVGDIGAKNRQLAEVIGQIRDAVAALTEQVQALGARVQAAQQEREQLRRRIAELEARPDQQAQMQELQQRVEELTRAITDANDKIAGIALNIDNLIRAADEGGITPAQVEAIRVDIGALGEQTRQLSLMLPAGDQIPPPANGVGRAGGGKKARRVKQSKRTRKMKRTKGRRQRGGYNWISSSASSRGRSRSTSSSSRTRSAKRRNKKSRSSL